MANKREMKIEINETQPLNLVVKTLEKLGFVKNGFDDKAKCVTTYADGTFSAWRFGIERCYHHNDLVTLVELNGLQDEG
ncbi:hypothetical protein [Acinetobacter seifertii]|uniref:hypothetical protein n=1 Tax=Acinetobacter seifertii TaxID=1530123 RepID=UPI001C0C5096|nr:hypothetical protein [Acinetobacter seifertii]MBU3084482.1 hypothetical protein [Acinetobacter seifertii]